MPEPLVPSTPILAPGKKLSDTSFKMWRLGGTILPRRFMEKTYWAIAGSVGIQKSRSSYYRLPAPALRLSWQTDVSKAVNATCDNRDSCGVSVARNDSTMLGTATKAVRPIFESTCL